MNYYCGNCGAEFHNVLEADYTACPFCKHKGLVQKLPDFETPEQYEARCGKPLPDKMHTFLFSRRSNTYEQVYYKYAKKIQKKHGAYLYPFIVFANVPKAPPDDWRPE